MSEDEHNLVPRKTYTFTIDERKLLLKLVNTHYDVVNNKRVDSNSTTQKNQAWEAIHKQYMGHSSLVRFPRTVQQLKRCWENMKCKAKKGDAVSVKLLRWGENQYRISHNGTNPDPFQEESDSDVRDGDSYVDNIKVEESHVLSDSTNNFVEAIDKTCGQHCACDQTEREARLQLVAMQKQHLEEIHNLKVQLKQNKIKTQNELHKLAVHELTLRVENERRRAEILEKELGN